MRGIKLYGGVLHGQIHCADEYASRIETHIPHRVRMNYFQPWRQDPGFMDMDLPDRQTYTIEIFHEARGRMRRQIEIGVIDGEKNLTERERYEIGHDLSRLTWTPVRPPSILNEFESWWNQTLYRHTGKEQHLYPEFERNPYS